MIDASEIPDSITTRRRLGIIVPSSNTVVEPAVAALVGTLGDILTVHFTRISVTEIAAAPGSHAQFAPAPMVAAARLLADARVDAILWAGTSGAWRGLDADRAIVAAIAAATGRPATTATLSLMDAFRVLEVHRYALLVPYVAAIETAIVTQFAAAGVACVASDRDDLTENWAFAAVPAASIDARARRLAAVAPDAIVIHCTNLRGAEVAGPVEAATGVPVLDSNVVGLWGAMRLLGIAPAGPGFGRLGADRGLHATTGVDA